MKSPEYQNKIKVAILSDDFPPANSGGASVVTYNMAEALLRKGHEVLIITTVRDEAEVGEAEYQGLRVIKIYSNYRRLWRAYLGVCHPKVLKQMEKILADFRPTITHAHNIHYHLSFAAIKVAKKYSRGVFATIHDVMPFHYSKLFPRFFDEPSADENYQVSAWRQLKQFKWEYNPFRNILIRNYLNQADGIIAVSQALKNALLVNGFRNLSVIHNGIDTDVWTTDSEALEQFRQKHQISQNNFNLFFGGRISPAKGSKVIIDALAKLPLEKRSKVKLLVAGKEDSGLTELKASAKVIGLSDNIVTLGWLDREEIKLAYALSDAVIVPSLCFDWFPTNNLEAMASGKPVIATCFGGSQEAVIDGKTGFIVNPYKITSVSNAIKKLIDNSVLAKHMGEIGQERAGKLFSQREQVDQLLEIYREKVPTLKVDFLATEFYDEVSVSYSERRYNENPQNYNQFFFNRRLSLLKNLIKGIEPEKNEKNSVLEIGCADGVILRRVQRAFPERFENLVGVDISPKMIEQAIKFGSAGLSFFLKDNTPKERFDLVMSLGFLTPSIFDQEFAFIKSHLKSDGYVFCTIASKDSIATRLKLRDKDYAKDYQSFSDYEKFLRKDFEIIAKKPYGLFVPKLWAMPVGIARPLQGLFETIFSFWPSLYHEKLYLLRPKVAR